MKVTIRFMLEFIVACAGLLLQMQEGSLSCYDLCLMQQVFTSAFVNHKSLFNSDLRQLFFSINMGIGSIKLNLYPVPISEGVIPAQAANSSLQIVWFDPNVANSQNTMYQKKYLQGKYNYICYQNIEDTVKYIDFVLNCINGLLIQHKKGPKRVIVISSDSQGESLCKALQGRNIEGIIIFSMNITSHQKWMSNYQSLIINVSNSPEKVFEMGFNSLKGLSMINKGLSNVSTLELYMTQKSEENSHFNINDDLYCKAFIQYATHEQKIAQFQSDFQPLVNNAKPLHEIIQSRSNFVMLTYYRQQLAKLDFKKGYTIVQDPQNKIITISNSSSNPSDIFQQCVQRSMAESSLCSAQVFLKLFELCEDKNKKIKLQKEVVDKCDLSTPRNVLATFCLMYTGDMIYRKLNEKMANLDLPFSIELIACLRNQIAALSAQDLKLVTLSPNEDAIYRGIKTKTSLSQGMNAFWPAFASTSLNVKKAASFAGNNGGEMNIIYLDRVNPHPHLILTGDSPLKSKYSTEEEILLFPNFKFRVTYRSDNKVFLIQRNV